MRQHEKAQSALLGALFHQFTHTGGVIQLPLADTQALGGAFQQLVICQELQALLQRHDSGGNQTDGFVRTGRAHIGQLLTLADVDSHILVTAADTDNHAGIDRSTGSLKGGAGVCQGIKNEVSYGVQC